MAQKAIGLTSILMGSIATDGGMGTALTQVGATVSDSAAITTAEGTKTDFNIEESDNPFFSIESTPGTKQLAWSTYDVDLNTLARFWGGSVSATVTSVLTLGALTAGSGYVNGTYYDVPLTGGTGTGVRATVTIAGGLVTAVVITYGGTGYTAAGSLSAANTNLGGTGSGFAIVISTVGAGSEAWLMPDSLPVIERSILITTKDLWQIAIPRLSITARMQWNLKKTALAQIDISGTILKPTKVGEPSTTFYEPLV